MSTRSTSTSGGNPTKGMVPTWSLILCIVFIIILGVLLAFVWISLQNSIREQRNNLCPNINTEPNP